MLPYPRFGIWFLKCEKLNLVNQSFSIRKTHRKSLFCTELFLIFHVYIMYVVSCVFLLLSSIWSPPGSRLQNNKVRRFAFELKMQDKSTYLLASDSEGEMEDWINTLNKILHSSFEIAMQEKRNGDIHDGACFYSTWRNANMRYYNSKYYSELVTMLHKLLIRCDVWVFTVSLKLPCFG